MIVEIPIIAGIIASSLHVLSGPDHLAAVTPMAIDAQSKVWRIGFSWGFGHLVGMLLIGLLFLLFQDAIPVESISEYSEQLVAFVLIGIGLWSLYKIFYQKNKSRPHLAISEVVNTNEKQHSELSKRGIQIKKNYAFSIGVLHGLAGVAHFLLLLPALGFVSQFESLQYILGFAFGTLIAMSVYTYLLGKINKDNPIFSLKILRILGGAFALVVGIYWLYLSL